MSIFFGKSNNISVLQFKILQDDINKNLSTASELINQASDLGSNIICLPQAFGTGLNFASVKEMAQSKDGQIVTFLSENAKQKKVHIIAGFLEKSGNEIYDSAIIINPSGDIVGIYHRKSLWTGEYSFLSAGEFGHAIQTEIGKIGLLVGYDLRFPETTRNYFRERTNLIVCVTNIFQNYGFPIEVICRARAADNMCYFVLASGLGTHKFVDSDFLGNSMIIDGTYCDIKSVKDCDILAKANFSEMVLTSKINIQKLAKMQKSEPLDVFFEDYENGF